MAITRKDTRIHTRSSRSSLTQRTEPYWRTLSKGLAVGYRKGANGGTWIARHFEVATGRRVASLGVSDDFTDADGSSTLSFDQAQDAARRWYKRLSQEDTGEVHAGKYTVAQAMHDYITDRERAKRKTLHRTRLIINAHIIPAFGTMEVAKLTHGKVRAWRDALADAAPRARTRPGKVQAFREYDPTDADAVRRRQATANRILTTLKAALNHAHQETKRVGSDAAWATVKPFRKVDVAKIRFLTAGEVTAFIGACADDFVLIAKGALVTGCRYGELTEMQVSAFDAGNQTVFIPFSKNGSSRYVELNAEGTAFFTDLTKGRSKGDLMFLRGNGKQWKHTEQKRPMDAACKIAGIEPAISFHILRHTYASHLAQNETPMRVIADQLGHKDTRITERHYAHLGRDHVRDTIRAKMPSFGFATV